jgi:hypothetical protein
VLTSILHWARLLHPHTSAVSFVSWLIARPNFVKMTSRQIQRQPLLNKGGYGNHQDWLYQPELRSAGRAIKYPTSSRKVLIPISSGMGYEMTSGWTALWHKGNVESYPLDHKNMNGWWSKQHDTLIRRCPNSRTCDIAERVWHADSKEHVMLVWSQYSAWVTELTSRVNSISRSVQIYNAHKLRWC